jgi:hypothetical protein
MEGGGGGGPVPVAVRGKYYICPWKITSMCGNALIYARMKFDLPHMTHAWIYHPLPVVTVYGEI